MSPRSSAANRRMREASRAAIVRAALEAFAEGGFHRTTVEEVARRAGVSKGLIYHHFESKTALLEAILLDRVETNASLLLDAPEGATPRERLRRLMEGAIEEVLAHPDVHRLTFALLIQPGMKDMVRNIESSLVAREREIQRAARSLFDELGSDQPQVDSFAFQCALTGLALTLAVQPELAEDASRFPLSSIMGRLMERFFASHP